MAVRYENECVGCPKEMGCRGDSCPYKNVPHFICDKCEDEVDTLYNFDGRQMCEACIKECFTQVKDDYYDVDGELVYTDDLLDYIGAEEVSV